MTKLSSGASKLYTWIPTNLGYLNFNYIADVNFLDKTFSKFGYELDDKKECEKKIIIHKTSLTDLNPKTVKIYQIDDICAKCEIKIMLNKGTESKTENLSGSITLEHSDNKALLFIAKSNFTIKLNGEMKLYDIDIQYCDKKATIKKKDKQAVYDTSIIALATLLKKVIHRDNHHDQKVDTLIGVYETFNPNQILTDLAFQIKRMEKSCKNEQSTQHPLYAQQLLNLPNEANGFMSYINTFKNLFENELKKTSKQAHYVQYDNIENVVDSIKASVSKLQQKKIKKSSAKTLLLTLFAILISYIIMLNGYLVNHREDNSVISWLATNTDVAIYVTLLVFIYFTISAFKIAYGYIGNFFAKNKDLYELFILASNTTDKTLKRYYNNRKYLTLIILLIMGITSIFFGLQLLNIILN